MAEATTVTNGASTAPAPLKLDAAIIGAGVAGLYQLHLLRGQGLGVKAFDTASDVGGTWYWNRYPGARFDSEAYIYQYLFDEELYKGWSWSEKFPGQPEIERWMHYVADRLDLRKDIQFNTTIKEARFDEALIVVKLRQPYAQRIAFDFVITARKHQIPIGTLYLRNDLNRALAKLTVGNVQPLFRQFDRAATKINVFVAKQRLNEADVQARRNLRIQVIEGAFGRRTIVVQRTLHN